MERTRAEMRTLAAMILQGTPPEEAVPLTWPLVCGQRVAKCTRATTFSDGELTVEVPDAAWRNELAGYMPQYMHQLTSTTGAQVTRIRFVVAEGSAR